ncbi:MAG: hypothetical protein C4K60_07140 [Ideonella sp. MAG2]|nr:MAG: hypothetical protein C4K60_07140 [Ideonella sp. MAG2]
MSHPSRAPFSRRRSGALCLLAALVLVACGGASDDPNNSASSAADLKRGILAAAPATGGGVLINEVVAGSWLGTRDEDGDAEDWVELYNPSPDAITLTGYGLSNKTSTPFQWVFPAGTSIPPKGYLTVWLSKKNRTTVGAPLHASFNLDSGSDPLILTASNATATGILVDQATPPLLHPDQSWCRMPSGSGSAPFLACDTPTPGLANAGTANATVLTKPVLSLPSGFYASAQTVSIAGPAGATLRYTTDGSEPTAASPIYGGPLSIATPTVLRVAAFANNASRSWVETGNYVVDATLAPRYAGLKAMMVAMDPKDLQAYQANDKTHDFQASFELITGGSTSVFKMDAQGAAGGQIGSSFAPQRLMNIKASDAFGAKAFPGVLWPDKPYIISSKKLRLRNGSNDWASGHIRDQLSQKIGGLGGSNLTSSSTSVAVFINGKYYGLMDLREREEETLPAANLGIDKDFVDYISDPLLSTQEIKNGGAAALASYQAMHDFVLNNDMAQPANYAQAKTLLNPESLAWDWALHLFHANYDWPGRNVHVWRSPEVDQRWNWHSHDMDFSFSLYSFLVNVKLNMYSSFNGAGSELINALMRNPEFRQLYLNTVADQLNIMTPATMNATLDGMAGEMRPYIADYYAKSNLGATSNWESNIAALRDWLNQREVFYDEQTRAHFNVPVRQGLRVTVSDRAMGSVKVNSLETGKYMAAGSNTWRGTYYPGVPVTLEAIPKPGYTFVGWQGAANTGERRITQTLLAGAATPSVPPATAVTCATDGQVCALPAGPGATVWYGVGNNWTRRDGLSGNVNCNVFTFGDPAWFAGKSCRYVMGTGSPDVELTAVFAASGAASGPTLATLAPQAWKTGDLVSVTLSATDAGGNPITYSAKTLPKGLSINPATGVIYGRATTPGVYKSTLSASNGAVTSSQSVTWTVTDRVGSGLLGTSPDSGTAPPPPPPGNQAPTVALTAPQTQATVMQGADITLSANASDSDGRIDRVEFYDGGALIGISTNAPYRLAWPNAGAGVHALSARAVDNYGAATSSATVYLAVAAKVSAAPADAVVCATENQICAVPAGSLVTVWYGVPGAWSVRSGLSGSVACNYTNFGDPAPLQAKSCRMRVDTPPPDTVQPGTGTGLLGRYYTNNSFSGEPVLVRQETIDFNWAQSGPFAAGPVDNFSARWMGPRDPDRRDSSQRARA